jgi:hypothetical protein
MPQRGRRPVLDETKKGEILTIIAVGCTRQIAARYVGCDPRTIRRTARRDPIFAERLRQAGRNAEVGLLRRIRKASKKEQYWRAAAGALERVYPERYARRNPKVMTREHVAYLMKQLADLFAGQLPARYRKTVLRCVEQMIRKMKPA